MLILQQFLLFAAYAGLTRGAGGHANKISNSIHLGKWYLVLVRGDSDSLENAAQSQIMDNQVSRIYRMDGSLT